MKPSDFARPVEKVPPGWKTARGWAQTWARTPSHTFCLLARGVAAKTVKVKKFVIKTGSRTYPVPHYAEA